MSLATSRFLAIVICLTSTAAPARAVASDQAFASSTDDVVTIRRCLDGNDERAMTCIGQIADGCLAKARHEQPWMARMNCWSRENHAWEQLLNNKYKELASKAKLQDTATGPYLERNSYEMLEDSQQKWLVFRDAELGRFWAMRAPASASWRAADLERVRLRLTVDRFVELSME
ncbi:lysozyme inhibitor LprI family protein [Novosphingobium sp. ZN18A2]|uniref:lysozyme inhibitor LprI family protein n=1 Tax=Novosphingobium sp. ZN18A2 TaxID=3079861 RepID=UPI0030CB29F6